VDILWQIALGMFDFMIVLVVASKRIFVPLAKLINLLLPIQGGVIVLIAFEDVTFIKAEMTWVNRHAVVLMLASLSDQNPISLLFAKIQSGSIGDKDQRKEETGKAEPSNDVKFGLIGDVIVQNGRSESTEFTTGSREAVGRSSNGSGIEFSSKEKCRRVRSELLPEGSKHVEEREGFDGGPGFLELIEFEGADNKDDENDEEAYRLHSKTAVESVVDKKGGHIVTNQGDPDVQEVPVPPGHDGGSGIEDLDEGAGKDFGAVEEEIVAEPIAGCSDEAMPIMTKDELQRFDVVTGDIILFLGQFQFGVGEFQSVHSVVNKIQGDDTDKGKRNSERPLSADLAVRWS